MVWNCRYTYQLDICSVTHSYLTLCNPMDCSAPGSYIQGTIHTRILEWVVISVRPDPGAMMGHPSSPSCRRGEVPNGRSLPDPGDQWQHTSPAKAAGPQPRRRTCQPATPRPGNLSEPRPSSLDHPLQRTYRNHPQHDRSADFLDLPHSVREPRQGALRH